MAQQVQDQTKDIITGVKPIDPTGKTALELKAEMDARSRAGFDTGNIFSGKGPFTGIVGGDKSGEDRTYAVQQAVPDETQGEAAGFEGLERLKTGEMAEQSIQQQTDVLSFDEFKEAIRSGQIPTVGNIPEGSLKTQLAIAESSGVLPEAVEKSNKRLDTAYNLYKFGMKRNQRPTAFGRETTEGEYVFTPTAEAEGSPPLLSTQEAIFKSQSSIARLSRNALGPQGTGFADLSDEDNSIIENILIRNLSTGTFWDTLSEKVYDDNVRGAGFLVDLGTNYLGHVIAAGAETVGNAAAYAFTLGNYNFRGFLQQWQDGEARRAKFSNNLRKHFLDPIGVRSLSSSINKMIRDDLKRQYDDGAIDKDTYDRLISVDTQVGEKEQTLARQFVTEDLAAKFLDDSISQLSESQDYALHLVSNTIALFGVGKARYLKGDAQLTGAINLRNNLKKKIDDGDATEAEIEYYGTIENLTPIQLGIKFKSEKRIKKFNRQAVEFAIGINTAKANISRLRTRLDEISIEKSDYIKNGGSVKDSKYALLESEQSRLKNLMIRTAYTGRFAPVLKETLKESAALSAVTYIGSQEGSFVREAFGGVIDDRGMAEGVSALIYLVARPTLFAGTGKAAHWVNMQGGDIQEKLLIGVETLFNLPYKFVGVGDISGFIATGDIAALREAYRRGGGGDDLPPETLAALTQAQKLGSVLSEEQILEAVSGAEIKMERMERIISKVRPEKRAQLRDALKTSFAYFTGIDFLKASQKLDSAVIDAADLNRGTDLDKLMQAQRILTLQSEKASLLIDEIKVILDDANVTDMDDLREIQNLKETLTNVVAVNAKNINNNAADLQVLFNNFKESIVTDPSRTIPDGLLSHIDDMNYELSLTLKGDVDELNLIQTQHAENVDLLKQRADGLRDLRDDRPQHIKSTAHNIELTIDNKLNNMLLTARAPLIKLDKKARKMGVSIPINQMVLDLLEYAPESDLQELFGKRSRLFVGKTGKRLYTAVNRMAARALKGIDPETYNKFIAGLTNENSDFYLGPNPKPLDILLHLDKLKKEKPDVILQVPELVASPGEVMDVHSAFLDYAYRTNDKRFESDLKAYADKLEKLIPEPLRKEWQAGREHYQAHWFDKLRSGSVLSKIHYSKDGPVRAVRSKSQAEYTDDDSFAGYYEVGIGEEVSEEVLNNRFLNSAYKGGKDQNPVTGLNSLGKKVVDALYGRKDDAVQVLVDEIENFKIGLSDIPQGDVFDLTDPNRKKEFEMLQVILQEVVEAGISTNMLRYLDKDKLQDVLGLPPQNVLEAGGYNWEQITNLKVVQDALTVSVKQSKDGKPVRMKLVDLDMIAEESASIERLIAQDNKVRQKAETYINGVKDKVDAIATATQRKAAPPDIIMQKIIQMSGNLTPDSFIKNYILSGETGADNLETILRRVKNELGETTTINDVVYDTEEVVDRGLSHIIMNSLFTIGGVEPTGKIIQETGMFIGKSKPVMVMNSPEALLDMLDNPEVEKLIKRYVRTSPDVSADKINEATTPMSDTHYNTLREVVEYLVAEVEYQRFDMQVTNRVRGMGMNQVISRSFNLARGMVSPQYVAAEFAVSLASHAGLDLMKLAARNEEANDLIIKMLKFPKQMTKADVNNFQTLVTEFVITEFGEMGLNGVQVLEDYGRRVFEEEQGDKKDEDLQQRAS